MPLPATVTKPLMKVCGFSGQATGGSVTPGAFAKLLTALGLDGSGSKRKADEAATPDTQKKAKTLMAFGFTKKEP